MSEAETPPRSPRERFARALAERFFLRFHVTLILAFTFSAGIIASRSLYAWGLHSMALRYGIALVVAYAAFLLACRLWIHYVASFGDPRRAPRRELDKRDSGDASLPDFSFGSGGDSTGTGGGSVFHGGGGGSGGGGASASFASPGSSPGAGGFRLGLSSGSSGSSSGGGSFDPGDAIALVLLIGVIAAIAGTVVYVIAAGPTILADSAFEALMAGTVTRGARGLHESSSGWLGSLVRATWIPVTVVFVLLVSFGWYAQSTYPDLGTAREVLVRMYEIWLN